MLFQFPAKDEFLNRTADLERMEEWWNSRDRNAFALYGRRRVGKSWLLRRFAHGKPALILVSQRRAQAAQLNRFTDAIVQHFGGLRPAVPDLATLISVLYELAREEKQLVVIDEFPYLLPTRGKEQHEVLTGIQAAMEERDASRLKLVLCGSHIGQMTSLLGAESPLRGRLTPMAIEPLRFKDAQEFVEVTDPVTRIERYAVTGGMTLYLDAIGRGQDLKRRICERVLNPRMELFNDPREVLEEELRQPGIYFSLLEELAVGERSMSDLATAIGRKTTDLGPYVETLRDMRLVEKVTPITDKKDSRDTRFRVQDGFIRFWFRFVFPFQDDLRAGLHPKNHYAGEIAPFLPEQVAIEFENLCREWTRQELGGSASRVGSWWGKAVNHLRRSGERSSEEIDIVGIQRSEVTILGECKWTSGPMTTKTLADLEAYKIPALQQTKVRFTSPRPLILLFSRSGFKNNLTEIADGRDDIHLITATQLVADLLNTDH